MNTYFSTFHLYVEIHFYTADGPGPSLATVPGGLVVRIHQSLTRNRNPAISLCKSRPAKIKLTVIKKKTKNTKLFCLNAFTSGCTWAFSGCEERGLLSCGVQTPHCSAW